MVSAAANYAESDNNQNSNIYLQSMAETAGRIGEKIADKNLNIQPTIQIRPGWTFNIFVHKDMILKPYKI
jgi:type IV secretory pathway VirB10-like protein